MTLFGRILASIVRRLRYLSFILRARSESKKNLAAIEGHNVLVLCYGNIFRSPFAANRLTSILETLDWNIRSAGFYEKSGRSCSEDFIELAREFDVDLAGHRSSQVRERDMKWADIIIIMDAHNRDLLQGFGRDNARKAVWAGAWLPSVWVGIVDPFGESVERLWEITARLNQAVDSLAMELKRVSF